MKSGKKQSLIFACFDPISSKFVDVGCPTIAARLMGKIFTDKGADNVGLNRKSKRAYAKAWRTLNNKGEF